MNKAIVPIAIAMALTALKGSKGSRNESIENMKASPFMFKWSDPEKHIVDRESPDQASQPMVQWNGKVPEMNYFSDQKKRLQRIIKEGNGDKIEQLVFKGSSARSWNFPVEILKDLTHLKSLWIGSYSGNMYDDKNSRPLSNSSELFDELKKLPYLRELVLDGHSIHPEDIERLGQLNRLRKLRIQFGHWAKTYDIDIRKLSNLKRLDTLNIDISGSVTGLESLASMPRLRLLSIKAMNLSSIDLNQLSDLPLRRVEIERRSKDRMKNKNMIVFPDHSASILSESLIQLNIKNLVAETNDNLSNINNLPSLEDMNILLFNGGDFRIQGLNKLTQATIQVNGYVFFEPNACQNLSQLELHAFVASGMEHLPNLYDAKISNRIQGTIPAEHQMWLTSIFLSKTIENLEIVSRSFDFWTKRGTDPEDHILEDEYPIESTNLKKLKIYTPKDQQGGWFLLPKQVSNLTSLEELEFGCPGWIHMNINQCPKLKSITLIESFRPKQCSMRNVNCPEFPINPTANALIMFDTTEGKNVINLSYHSFKLNSWELLPEIKRKILKNLKFGLKTNNSPTVSLRLATESMLLMESANNAGLQTQIELGKSMLGSKSLVQHITIDQDWDDGDGSRYNEIWVDTDFKELDCIDGIHLDPGSYIKLSLLYRYDTHSKINYMPLDKPQLINSIKKETQNFNKSIETILGKITRKNPPMSPEHSDVSVKIHGYMMAKRIPNNSVEFPNLSALGPLRHLELSDLIIDDSINNNISKLNFASISIYKAFFTDPSKFLMNGNINSIKSINILNVNTAPRFVFSSKNLDDIRLEQVSNPVVIPESSSELTKLRSVNIGRNCNLVNLPIDFLRLPKLKHFSLSMQAQVGNINIKKLMNFVYGPNNLDRNVKNELIRWIQNYLRRKKTAKTSDIRRF